METWHQWDQQKVVLINGVTVNGLSIETKWEKRRVQQRRSRDSSPSDKLHKNFFVCWFQSTSSLSRAATVRPLKDKHHDTRKRLLPVCVCVCDSEPFVNATKNNSGRVISWQLKKHHCHLANAYNVSTNSPREEATVAQEPMKTDRLTSFMIKWSQVSIYFLGNKITPKKNCKKWIVLNEKKTAETYEGQGIGAWHRRPPQSWS